VARQAVSHRIISARTTGACATGDAASAATPGGDLGPIYGPRYMRTQSRILVVFMMAVIAYSLAAPSTMGWRAAPHILLATALLVVWSIAWRRHLGRKWKLEQSAAPSSAR